MKLRIASVVFSFFVSGLSFAWGIEAVGESQWVFALLHLGLCLLNFGIGLTNIFSIAGDYE